MRIDYYDNGLDRSTENVWVDWPDGYCWLVANEFGVIGAVLTMNDGEQGWIEAHEAAVDEIAHDVDPDFFDSEEELQMAIDDGMVTYRSNGVPSNERRSSALADTGHLTVFRHPKKMQRERKGVIG